MWKCLVRVLSLDLWSSRQALLHKEDRLTPSTNGGWHVLDMRNCVSPKSLKVHTSWEKSAAIQQCTPHRMPTRRWFGLYHSMYSFVETVAILLCGFLPWLWVHGGHMLLSLPPSLSDWLRAGTGAAAGGGASRLEIAQTVVFVLLLLVSGVKWL